METIPNPCDQARDQRPSRPVVGAHIAIFEAKHPLAATRYSRGNACKSRKTAMCARQIANGHPRLFLQETRFAVASVTMNTPHHHNGIMYM